MIPVEGNDASDDDENPSNNNNNNELEPQSSAIAPQRPSSLPGMAQQQPNKVFFRFFSIMIR